jgi:phosphatidylethanolamine-binding protein (PEBP) family uncharacterized protein
VLAVVDIPASVASLTRGAGDDKGAGIPAGAFQLPNDARLARYVGAAPPPGNGKYRYFIVVHAVDVSFTRVVQGRNSRFSRVSICLYTLSLGL